MDVTGVVVAFSMGAVVAAAVFAGTGAGGAALL